MNANFVDQIEECDVRQERQWDLPVPIDTSRSVPSFPVEVFPELLRDLIQSVALATNSPPDYVGVPVLGIAAGAIGATYKIELKEGYEEYSSHYVCVVAPKGTGKTPALTYLMDPVIKEQVRRNKGDSKEVDNKEPAFVDDVTVEKLADLMQKTPRGLLMVRDELTALLAGFN